MMDECDFSAIGIALLIGAISLCIFMAISKYIAVKRALQVQACELIALKQQTLQACELTKQLQLQIQNNQSQSSQHIGQEIIGHSRPLISAIYVICKVSKNKQLAKAVGIAFSTHGGLVVTAFHILSDNVKKGTFKKGRHHLTTGNKNVYGLVKDYFEQQANQPYISVTLLCYDSSENADWAILRRDDAQLFETALHITAENELPVAADEPKVKIYFGVFLHMRHRGFPTVGTEGSDYTRWCQLSGTRSLVRAAAHIWSCGGPFVDSYGRVFALHVKSINDGVQVEIECNCNYEHEELSDLSMNSTPRACCAELSTGHVLCRLQGFNEALLQCAAGADHVLI